MIGRFYVGCILAFLYLPVVVIVVFSFNELDSTAVFSGFSLRWYAELLEDREITQAAVRSLGIAAGSSVSATALGFCGAYATAQRAGSSNVWPSVIGSPLIIPDLVLGIMLLAWLSLVGIPLGVWSVWLGHTTFNLAFAYLVLLAQMRRMDWTVEMAARDLGAAPLRVLFLVTIPACASGIWASLLLCFTLSWDDFLVAFFTSGSGGTTLPVEVYSMIKFGVSPAINAVSVLILTVALSGAFALSKLSPNIRRLFGGP